MNFVREAKGYTSGHMAFNGTAWKVSIKGPLCACVSVFMHVCACLNVTWSPFSEFPRVQYSLTSLIQSAFNNVGKHLGFVKKPEKCFWFTQWLLKVQLFFFLFFFFKCVFCTLSMNSQASLTAIEDISVTEFRGHMCPDLNPKWSHVSLTQSSVKPELTAVLDLFCSFEVQMLPRKTRRPSKSPNQYS